jgi:hypothetical protein
MVEIVGNAKGVERAFGSLGNSLVRRAAVASTSAVCRRFELASVKPTAAGKASRQRLL